MRFAEIVQQIKFLDGYPDRWEELFNERLQKLDEDGKLKYWAYILHNMDVDKDGKLKEAHIHVAVALTDSDKISTIAGYFGVPKQQVQKVRQRKKVGRRWYTDYGGMLSYLTHRNASDKYQYPDDAVHAKDGFDWKAVRAKSEAEQAKLKSLLQLLNDIEKGNIRRCDMAQNIDSYLYIEYKKEIDRAFEFRDLIDRDNKNRNVEVIYIMGEPGSGKTTLAKNYCEENGYSYCVSASSRDPVQDYAGEEVLILDDLRPETFRLSDLLKLLDNNTSSSVNSRYHDKRLNVNQIIITTVLSITKFYLLVENDSEPIEQLKRRCKTYIELTNNEMTISRYQKETHKYKVVSKAPNPIIGQFDDEDKEDEEAAAICKAFGTEYMPEKYEDGGDITT